MTIPNADHHSFSQRILTWFAVHGRHHLPWQQHHKADQDKDIYAVWLSEIMLQQTQVATVLGYFERFTSRFDNVHALANADYDDIATLWAGLGYYARARNLHAGAKQLSHYINQHGHFPQDVATWQEIKGVGRSTAGAIVAMGVGGFGVICDGNVKRVLTRWAGIDDDITKSSTDKHLWEMATQLTPQHDSGKYAQAMMDMGATLCTRINPKCHSCPVMNDCKAYQSGNPTAYPVKLKKPPKPTRHSFALFIRHQQKTLWIQRPSEGIWGGLWCLALSNQDMDNHFVDGQILDFLGDVSIFRTHKQIKHTLTHFHWLLEPCLIELNDLKHQQLNQLLLAIHANHLWLADGTPPAIPTAMKKLGTLIQKTPHSPLKTPTT